MAVHADPPRRGLRVAIVGGGLGGMAAACALIAQGIHVTVHEQAAHIGEVGAGVSLAPNGIRVLARIGLGAAVEKAGVAYDDTSFYYHSDGTPVAPVLVTSSDPAEHARGIHRADLLQLLAARLPDGVIRTGHRCVGFSQEGDQAHLSFANGDTATADIVIGADGIHSVLRSHVTQPSAPVHSGSMAYRGIASLRSLPEWPRSRFEVWMGHGKHFLVFPVRGGSAVNYVGFIPSDQRVRESWSATGDPLELAREFCGPDWDPRIGRLLSTVKETFWWGLYDREPIERWTSGRLTLMGDAAHPMLPHLGQGVNQAIEDAAALAMMLRGATPEAAAGALVRYEQLRRPRTREVQLGSRANGRRYDSAYQDLRQRDQEMVEHRRFRLWLYDYDAEKAASECIEGSNDLASAAGRDSAA